MSEKKELRQQQRDLLDKVPVEELAAKSRQAGQILCKQPEYAKAEVVMVFLSLPHEIDTTSIVLRCWQDRKRVLAPKIAWNQRRLVPLEVRSLTEDLAISEMGLREPVSGIPFPISLIDLVIVPGLAFDDQGHRLGRGRGFYDRFLAHPEIKGVSCGLALEAQRVESLPVDPLDRSVALLVTDERVHRFAKK